MENLGTENALLPWDGGKVRKNASERKLSFDYVAQLGKRVMYHEDTSVEVVINRLRSFSENPEEVLNLLLEYDLIEFEQEKPNILDSKINGPSYPIRQDKQPVIASPKQSRSRFSQLIRKGLNHD